MENQQEISVQLDELIEKGRKVESLIICRTDAVLGLKNYSISDSDAYNTWLANCKRFLSLYYPDELALELFNDERRSQIPVCLQTKVHQSYLSVLNFKHS